MARYFRYIRNYKGLAREGATRFDIAACLGHGMNMTSRGRMNGGRRVDKLRAVMSRRMDMRRL
jgi:hypothetical protein